MFSRSDIVKVLVPDMFGSGYDYRAEEDCAVGDLAGVSVRQKNYLGIIIGKSEGDVAAEKIKPIAAHIGQSLPTAVVEWMKKMSDWTMIPMGGVWKLMSAAARFGAPKARQKAARAPEYFDTGAVVLNESQAAAAAAVKQGAFGVHLLDGVTGSGKTQVYFDSVLRTYQAGRQVLIMMPEIALTAQFAKRFQDRFGAAPIIWHSNLTPAKRRGIWHGVIDGDIGIVVGTRSALFLPWQNLGLIIVDEEHDSSYKQEDMGSYHARDMAVLLAKACGIPIVLASATPSFETIRNVMLGKYGVSKLTARYGGAMLPKTEIIDMRNRNAGKAAAAEENPCSR